MSRHDASDLREKIRNLESDLFNVGQQLQQQSSGTSDQMAVGSSSVSKSGAMSIRDSENAARSQMMAAAAAALWSVAFGFFALLVLPVINVFAVLAGLGGMDVVQRWTTGSLFPFLFAARLEIANGFVTRLPATDSPILLTSLQWLALISVASFLSWRSLVRMPMLSAVVTLVLFGLPSGLVVHALGFQFLSMTT